MINTFFNAVADNLSMLLNRKHNTRSMLFKMVKYLKKNDRHVNFSENKEKMEIWCVKYWKACLKSHEVILSGCFHVLRKRCVLSHMLVQYNIEHLIKLKMKELKEMWDSTSVEISSRDNMEKYVSNVLLNVAEDSKEDIMFLSLET